MTREELISYCKYYKGEKECPYSYNDNPKELTFWGMEKQYVESVIAAAENGVDSRAHWEERIPRYARMKDYSEAIRKKFTDNSIGIHTKGILVYMVIMLSKWAPTSVAFVEDY